LAESEEIFFNSKKDRPFSGWKVNLFSQPESTTNVMPFIVTLLSAILVAKIIFLFPGGVGAIAICCSLKL
jgi:hypothetical protein